MKFLLPLLAASIAAPVLAGELPGETGFALRATTLGFGVEVSRTLPVANLTGRLAWNAYTYETDDTIEGVPYELDLNLDSFTALLDWRPWGKTMHLTTGLVFNNNRIDAAGSAVDVYTIGGMTFAAADVGRLAGDATFDDVVPYAGLGWNVPLAPKTALSFELGVVFQGAPRLSLQADGLLASDSVFQAELEAERAQFEKDIESYQYYPVVGIGLRRQF